MIKCRKLFVETAEANEGSLTEVEVKSPGMLQKTVEAFKDMDWRLWQVLMSHATMHDQGFQRGAHDQ